MYFSTTILSLISIAVACLAFSDTPVPLPINNNICLAIYETVVVRLVAINYFFTATTVLTFGDITVNIDNVPTSISSLITVTQTSTVTATQTIVVPQPIIPLRALRTLDFSFLITLNNGTSPGMKREFFTNFTDPSGVVTNECRRGGIFTLLNGNLISQSREVSIYSDTGAQTFGAKSPIGSISSTFYVSDNILMWSNSAFETGNASFCTSGAQLFVIPDNVFPPNCLVQVLSIEPTSICDFESSTSQSSLKTLQSLSTTSDSPMTTAIASTSATSTFITPSSAATSSIASTTTCSQAVPTAYSYDAVGSVSTGSLSIVLTLSTQVCGGTGLLITNICGTYMLRGDFYTVTFDPKQTYGGSDFCFFPDNTPGSEIDTAGAAFETPIDIYSLYGFQGRIYIISNSTNPAGEADLSMPVEGVFYPADCGVPLLCPT